MATTEQFLTSGSATTSYTFSIDKIKDSDIKVKVNGSNLTYTTSTPSAGQYKISGSGITLGTAVDAIHVYRETELENGDSATYVAGSSIRAADLNANHKLVRFASQEQNQIVTTEDIRDSAITSAQIKDGTIVDGDISSTAEIAVNKLAQSGTNRQVLQTNGTNVEWTSNVDLPGTLDVSGAADFDSNVTVDGNQTVGGTLGVTGATTLSSLNASGNTVIGGNLDVTGTFDVTGTSNYTGQQTVPGGALVKNIRVGLDGASEVSTSSGNLTLDSATGTVAVDDALTVAGSLTVTGTTNLANDSIGSAEIDSSIVDGNIAAGAAIAHTKLAGAAGGKVLLGNSSNVVTATTVSGDVTINSSGVTSIASGSIVEGDIANNAVTMAKLASGALPTDITVNADNLVANSVGTSEIATDAVNGTKLADNAVDTEHIAADAVTTAKINNSAVTNAKVATNAIDAGKLQDSCVISQKIAANAVNGTKIADDAINSEHYVDGSIDTAHIANSNITTAKIADSNITTAKIADDAVTNAKIADGTLDGRYYTETELNAGQLDNRYYTETELNAGQLDNRYYTETESDARYFNISTGDTIKDGDTFPDNDTTIATTAAINDRIIDLVDDVGGFVPIANETSFPNANPDVNNGTGTLVSIKALSSNLTSNGSGVATIANGTVGNSTVTITGLANSTTYLSTYGLIVETTSTLNTYTFHRQVPIATEISSVAGSISNVNTVAGSISNVNAVAGNATNINAVAADATDIGAVAGKATEIGRLGTADAVSDMNTLGTTAIVSDLNTLADISSNITTVAGVSTNVTTVAGISGNVTTVAGNNSNITAVAGNATNINSAVSNASNINATAGSISNVNTVAGSISNVNTTAGSIANVNTVASNIGTVNDFSARYRTGANNPTSSLDTGDLFFNTSANELKVYNGSSWQGGVTASGNFASTTGNTWTGDNLYNDTVKAKFGTGSDLQINHSGSHAFIQNSTGSLIFESGTTVLRSGSQENYLVGTLNGGVEIFYDGVKKWESTSDGTSITGNLTLTSTAPYIQFTDSNSNPDWLLQNSNGAFVFHDGTTTRLQLNTDGHVDVTGNLDVGAGVDVTGNITVSGTVDGVDIAALNSTVSGLTTNATHSGEVTGSGALTIADNVVDEANLKVSNSPTNGYFLSAQSSNTGGLTWAEVNLSSLNASNLTSGTVAAARLDTATTQSAGNNSTKIATTAYADTAISNLVDSSPSALNTLNELAAALGDDANFSTTVTNSIATKLPLAGGQITGNITCSGSQTIDGRDLSTDGSKLDGIESGATADQTAAEIRTLVESASDSNVFTDADHSKLNGIAASANNYSHPSHNGDDFSVDTGALSGATVVSDIDINVTTDSSGHVTDANGSVSTRTLTLGNLGYSGATNANYITNNNQLTNGAGYVTSSGNTVIGTDSDIDTSGATIIDNLYMTDGVITSHGTRTLTLGNLGFTGATNANYITNNNQLSNGAGYITSANGGNAATLDSIDSSQFVRSDTADTITATLTARTIVPQSGNSYDLGSSSARWNNLYVNDMNFSNKGSSNSVDGTWGDWTLQEGEEDIFMINNRSGKKYKMALQEVS